MTFPLTLNPPSIHTLSEDQFFELCVANRDLRLERTANGEIIIVPSTGGDTGRRNISIAYQLEAWNRRTKLGVAFDSSTGFRLPNGAARSPDAAWIPLAKWEALTEQERERFFPLCPTFAIELRSPSDRLEMVQAKMVEYLANGMQLGWLVDPILGRVEVYVPGQAVTVLERPAMVSAAPVLSGFALDLGDIL